MNNLRLNITVPSLSFLTPVGVNQYALIIKFFDSDGNPLGNPNIEDVVPVTVTTTTTTFNVNVPVVEGNYVISNVVVKAFANDDEDCCFASKIIIISNEIESGDVQARVVAEGFFEHLDVDVQPEGDGYRIIDTTTYSLRPEGDTEWSYFLNEFWLRLGSARLNIFWPADTPLMIEKVQTKLGLDSLNHWSDGDPDGPGGYYDPEACITFSNNCSVAYVSLAFCA